MRAFWRRHEVVLALPPEPPVGALVQEVYGNGDLWRRTLGGWQMFNRYDGAWMGDTCGWAAIQEFGFTLASVDITAPAKPSKENQP